MTWSWYLPWLRAGGFPALEVCAKIRRGYTPQNAGPKETTRGLATGFFNCLALSNLPGGLGNRLLDRIIGTTGQEQESEDGIKEGRNEPGDRSGCAFARHG